MQAGGLIACAARLMERWGPGGVCLTTNLAAIFMSARALCTCPFAKIHSLRANNFATKKCATALTKALKSLYCFSWAKLIWC